MPSDFGNRRTFAAIGTVAAVTAIVVGILAVGDWKGRTDKTIGGLTKTVEFLNAEAPNWSSAIKTLEMKVDNLEDPEVEKIRDQALRDIDASKNQAIGQATAHIDAARLQQQAAALDAIHAARREAISDIEAELANASEILVAQIKATSGIATVSGNSAGIESHDEMTALERKIATMFQDVSDNQDSHLIVHAGERKEAKIATESFLSVTLERNSTLAVPSNFTKYSLYTPKLKVAQGARIEAVGKDGIAGAHGQKGRKSSDCVPGTNAADGVDGQNGTHGVSVELFATEFILAGRLTVDTSGGSGGQGGNGGKGGNGGRADRSKGCAGGNGGSGGNGGAAGDGGNGGNLSIKFARELSSAGGRLGQAILTGLVEHIATPGTEGLPGLGGDAGNGGPGRGKDILGRSLPGGSRGTPGNPGQRGQPGTRGSTDVERS